MPRKSDLIPINNPDLDRRYKLTREKRLEVRELFLRGGKSKRDLEIEYGVSRRLINCCIDPEKEAEKKKLRKDRGAVKQPYDREKHRLAIKEHRQYKKELNERNLLNNPNAL